jgi:RNA polymerase sigma factor (sigma-70 family)
MENYKETKKFLKKIFQTIRACKLIPYHNREDIISDVIANVFVKIKEGTVPKDLEENKNYFYMSLRNQCMMCLNKKSNIKYTFDYDFSLIEIEDTKHIDTEKLLNCLIDCCNDDLDKYVILFLYNGLTQVETAKKLNVHFMTINNRFKRIKKRFVKKYEKFDFF